MKISSQLTDLFAGRQRASLLPTLLVAAVVTVLVAFPLTVRAVEARGEPEVIASAASAERILVDAADIEPTPLDRQTVSGRILISYFDREAVGVSFSLFESGASSPILTSQDLVGPSFDLQLDGAGRSVPIDSTRLADGPYELFLTVVLPGGEQRTAVVFDVANQ